MPRTAGLFALVVGAAAWCQRDRADPPPSCSQTEAGLELHRRSYALPPRWPFPGQVRLVMETEAGTCNLYDDADVCCDMTTRRVDDIVERYVTETVAAFLAGCSARETAGGTSCHAADLGANNGWMTAYMLSLGAHVVSVEPQPDLAHAVAETAALNCWSHLSVVHNAFACADRKTRGGKCMEPRALRGPYWYRAGGPPPKRNSTPPLIPGLSLEEIFTGHRGSSRPAYYDLVKLDGDGPELSWMHSIRKMILDGVIDVQTIVIEANGMANHQGAALMRAYQQQGFDVYRFPCGDNLRLIGGSGWDVLSPPGTFGRLDRLGHSPMSSRAALEEEVLGLRGISLMYRVRDNLTLAQWRSVVTVNGIPHLLLTRDASLRADLRRKPAVGPVLRRSAVWKDAQQWAAPLVRQLWLQEKGRHRRRTDRGEGLEQPPGNLRANAASSGAHHADDHHPERRDRVDGFDGTGARPARARPSPGRA